MKRSRITFVAYSPDVYKRRFLCVSLSILFARAHTRSLGAERTMLETLSIVTLTTRGSFVTAANKEQKLVLTSVRPSIHSTNLTWMDVPEICQSTCPTSMLFLPWRFLGLTPGGPKHPSNARTVTAGSFSTPRSRSFSPSSPQMVELALRRHPVTLHRNFLPQKFHAANSCT